MLEEGGGKCAPPGNICPGGAGGAGEDVEIWQRLPLYPFGSYKFARD